MRNRWLLVILTLPFFFFILEPAHAQCEPGDILIGEDADNYYCMKRAIYEGSAAQKYSTQFCRAKQAVAADQTALGELNFALDTERFEMFENVAREQKAELQNKIFDALLDEGLEATGKALNKAKSLNPWNVNDAVEALRAKGFQNASIIAALRRIALQKDKPAMVAAYRDFVEVAKSAKEGWSTGSEMAKDPENSELRLMLGALKIMQGSPQLGLVITTTEFSESLVYLIYLSGNVRELTKVSDDKLARLAVITKRLKGHVDDMRTSKEAWQKSTGYKTATPVCDR